MATGTESLWQKSKFKIETLILGSTTVTATGSELNILSGVTATAAEINAAADVSGRIVNVTDAASDTVLVANSGKPHIMPDFTARPVPALPTAAGLEYPFYYKGVARNAQNWVINTGSDTNFFLSGLVHLDTDAGAAGDEVVPIAGDGNSIRS